MTDRKFNVRYFPKDFQGLFSMWQLPKYAIPKRTFTQTVTSHVCPSHRAWSSNPSYLKRQALPCSFWRIRRPNLRFGKLKLGKISNVGSCHLGNCQLEKCHLGSHLKKCLWENTDNKFLQGNPLQGSSQQRKCINLSFFPNIPSFLKRKGIRKEHLKTDVGLNIILDRVYEGQNCKIWVQKFLIFVKFLNCAKIYYESTKHFLILIYIS